MELLKTYCDDRVTKIGFTILLFFLGMSLGFSAQKRALLIGTGNQMPDSEWGAIHAQNDVRIIQASIASKGFADVTTLIEENATKIRTINALEALYARCESGDVFLFYFSGHGQLIADSDGDELDHYDEALVLYGAPKTYDAAYRNEHHLLDEELSELLNKFRMKLGKQGEVVVMIDAGFGWMDSLSEEYMRGGARPLEPNDALHSRGDDATNENGIIDDLPFAKPSDTYSNLIHFTATQLSLPAFEYEGNGIFTLAMARAIDEQQDSTTYQTLYGVLKSNSMAMKMIQTPLMEGRPDETMFEQITIQPEGRGIIESIESDVDAATLNILVNLKESEEGRIKNEVGKTDWEKSFFSTE